MINQDAILRKLLNVPPAVHFCVTPPWNGKITVQAKCNYAHGYVCRLTDVTSWFKVPHGQGQYNAAVKKALLPDAQALLDNALADLRSRGWEPEW